MSLKTLLNTTVIPAAIGAAGAIAAKKLGYDISMIEGARQAVIASLPITVLAYSSEDSTDKFDEWAGDHPYLAPIALGATGAVVMLGGGACMEWLTKYPISEKFVAGCGGLLGIIGGIRSYSRGKNFATEVYSP
jgi:hypothetical protein